MVEADVDDCTGTVSLVCNERAWAVRLWLSLLQEGHSLSFGRLKVRRHNSGTTLLSQKRASDCASLSAIFQASISVGQLPSELAASLLSSQSEQRRKGSALQGPPCRTSIRQLGSINMPQDGAADPVARSLSKIFCERASFELKDDDIQAYRNHIRQQAATIVAKAQEDEEYLAWKVGPSLLTTPCLGHI